MESPVITVAVVPMFVLILQPISKGVLALEGTRGDQSLVTKETVTAATMAMVVKIRGDRGTAPSLCMMQKSWRLHGAGQVA